MDITKFEVPAIMAIVWILIQATKGLIPETGHKFIPLICAALGVLLNVWMNNWSITPDILLGGLASGWAATGLNETIKKLSGSETTVA